MAKRKFWGVPAHIYPDQADPNGSVVYRPLLYARIRAANGRTLTTNVLLDSGADRCAFPLSMARALQIDVNKLPQSVTRGVGNNANVTYIDTINIDLGFGLEFQARVGFSDGLDTYGIGLLGYDGFFNRFNVEFRLAEGIFTIEAAAKPAIQ